MSVAAVGSAPARPAGRDVVVIAVAALFLVAAVPGLGAPFFTPRAAVLLVVAGPGLVVLAAHAAARDRAAIAGVAFVALAGLATLLSPDRLLALVGLYDLGTGWVFVAGTVGLWALGRELSVPGRRVLGTVLVAGATLTAIVAWLQMSGFDGGVLLGRVDGRAHGLMGNPVFASALLLGALALVGERWPAPGDAPGRLGEQRGPLLAVLAAVLASALQLTGGRTGLVLVPLIVVRLGVRIGWRRTLPVVVALVVGVGVAAVAFRSGTDATSRLGGGGIGGRIDRWELAVPAVADRPLLGIGPGLWRRATSPHDTVEAARAFGSDRLHRDAHDLLVEYVVTTGVLGAGALVLWLVLAARGARGELAWFALFGGVSLLVQPQSVALVAVLALALGGAGPGRVTRITPVGVVIGGALAAAGLVVAVVLVRGDVALHDGVTGRDPARLRAATSMLEPWPEPAQGQVDVHLRRAETAATAAVRDRELRAARAAARVAVARDRSDPASWLRAGRVALLAGDDGAARRAYAAAWRWDPASQQAAQGLALLAARRDDAAAVRRWCRRVRAIRPGAACPPVDPAG